MKKFNRGQTIIEAVVALSLIILVLTGITIAVSTSVNNSAFIKNQTIGAKFAQAGMEYLRFLRNNPPTTPPTFDTYALNSSASNSAYCMDTNNVLGDNNGVVNGLAGPSCTRVFSFSGGQFIREVLFNIDPNTSGCSGGTRVTVNVYWSSGKCSNATINTRYCHKSQIVSCLSKPSSSGNTL